ncbi:hypothetical protein [Paenibacillus illinoisensis]|uniref:hypothetical protein n=1 Tax=Paenibacillus illinoisensis TaxID=59845 RepID=UPI000FDBB76A|nr:hypothetical protein [Paenibacillus illinoisensis]
MIYKIKHAFRAYGAKGTFRRIKSKYIHGKDKMLFKIIKSKEYDFYNEIQLRRIDSLTIIGKSVSKYETSDFHLARCLGRAQVIVLLITDNFFHKDLFKEIMPNVFVIPKLILYSENFLKDTCYNVRKVIFTDDTLLKFSETTFLRARGFSFYYIALEEYVKNSIRRDIALSSDIIITDSDIFFRELHKLRSDIFTIDMMANQGNYERLIKMIYSDIENAFYANMYRL